MTVQYLLTVTKKTESEIMALLGGLNISGEVLVGNQLMGEDREYALRVGDCRATIYAMKSKGVSRNRNFLIMKANADYIAFLDDDMYYEEGAQEKIESLLEENQHDAVRFNVVSDNEERPIKQLSAKGFVGFRQISSYGVCGGFYRRRFLIDNNLFFREDIGPGTDINHGEDGLFNRAFLKRSKIYSVPELTFHARQRDSTWQGASRDLKLEMFSHGYVYQLLYPKCSRLMARLFVASHMRCYPKGTKMSFLIGCMDKGIKAAKGKEFVKGGVNRVLILGPVVNDRTSGGVAVFDEGLCNGFRELGDVANILSIEKSKSIDNIALRLRRPKPLKIFFHLRKIAKLIRAYEPEMVISSLHYSLGIRKYKKAWPHAKYVQVLHGFPCPINGRFKSWCVNKTASYSRKHFDYVVTVSYLSYAINKKINRIVCDRVIHNGCALLPNNIHEDRVYDFIYIGRLFRDKEVEMIGEAFKIVKQKCPHKRLAVAGYGELESLFIDGKFKDCGIEYLGRLSQDEVRECLGKSRFFISMNPLEPFGTVFSEALINGCNVVTQSSTGSIALLLDKPYFHCVDCLNAVDLSKRLIEVSGEFVEIGDSDKQSLIDYLSFKRVALEYKSLIEK